MALNNGDQFTNPWIDQLQRILSLVLARMRNLPHHVAEHRGEVVGARHWDAVTW